MNHQTPGYIGNEVATWQAGHHYYPGVPFSGAAWSGVHQVSPDTLYLSPLALVRSRIVSKIAVHVRHTGAFATITSPGLPSWLALQDMGNGMARLTGTPTAGDLGDTEITLHLTGPLGYIDDVHTITATVADEEAIWDIQTAAINGATTDSKIRLGIRHMAPDLTPGDLVFDAGEAWVVDAGLASIDIPGGLTLRAGEYWLECVSDGAPLLAAVPASASQALAPALEIGAGPHPTGWIAPIVDGTLPVVVDNPERAAVPACVFVAFR